MAGFLTKPAIHSLPDDPAGSLLHGLVAAYLLGEKAGPTAHDSWGGKRNDLTYTGTPTVAYGEFGPHVVASTDTVRLDCGNAMITGAGATVAALVRVPTVGFAGCMAFNNYTSGTGDGWTLALDGNSAPKWYFQKIVGYGGSAVAANAAATANVWQLVVGSCDLAGNVALWVNGVKQTATTTTTGTTSGATSADLAIGGASRPLHTAMLAVWDRGLSDAEHRSLWADPFRLWRPADLFAAAGAAPPTANRRRRVLICGGR